MEKLTLNVPAMYSDHHVTEVRRLLLAMDGIDSIYASSCFQVVEVTFDPGVIEASAIEATLADAGYTDVPVFPDEGNAPQVDNGKPTFFRHTKASAQTGATIGFGQQVSYTGRPLWPCPGMGVIENKVEDYG